MDPSSSNCFYCGKFGLVRVRTAVIHDARGCFSVCDDHRAWRNTTSRLFGHGENCPSRGKITVKS